MLPYHRQLKDWTCGAACARMVLDGLGFDFSENELASLLKTTKKSGTFHKEFPKLFERLNVKCSVRHNSSLSAVKDFLNSGYIVVVCYWLSDDKTGHYSILKRIDSDVVNVEDPWFGPFHVLKKSWFLKNWKCTSGRRWLCAVKP